MESNSTKAMLTDFMQPTETKGPENVGAQSNASNEPEVIIEPEPKAISADEPKEPKERMLSANTQAEVYIGVFDTAQTLILDRIAKKKLERRLGNRMQEAEQLFNEIESGRLQQINLTPDQYTLFMRIKSMMEIRDMIPFSDEEYKKLQVPLSKIIQESGHDLPPGMALVLVGLEVMGPRLADVIFE